MCSRGRFLALGGVEVRCQPGHSSHLRRGQRWQRGSHAGRVNGHLHPPKLRAARPLEDHIKNVRTASQNEDQQAA